MSVFLSNSLVVPGVTAGGGFKYSLVLHVTPELRLTRDVFPYFFTPQAQTGNVALSNCFSCASNYGNWV